MRRARAAWLAHRARLAAPPTGRRAAALLVHVFTASGAALGFFALLAATRHDFAEMFAWLAVALIVDGIDGTFARRADVGRYASRFSGDVLDLVVDYLTYVVVPTYALVLSGDLSTVTAAIAAVLICVTSALYFADTTMKTRDHYFRGFPGVWNVVVFYLLVLNPPEFVSMGLIMLCATLSFAPIPFLHPLRVQRNRNLTLAVLLLGFVLAAVTIAADLDPAAPVKWGLAAVGLYFALGGLFRRRTV